MNSNPNAARVKMADIAKLAGVSVSTASRAFAGSPLVPEPKREEILQIALEKGYVVNRSAQRLRRGRTDTIGVVIPLGTEPDRLMSDPFFMQMIGHLADAISARGYDVLLIKVADPTPGWLSRLVASHRADGLIVVGQSDQHEVLNTVARSYGPMVVWGAHLPEQAYCSVGVDNVGGGQMATEHLFALGRTRVAFIGGLQFPEAAQRHEGYLLAHRRAGIEPHPDLRLDANFTAGSAETAIDALLQAGPPFDAVFATSDTLAIGAMRALRRVGRRTPEQVAVVGFDDLPMAVQSHPSLTTVRQDLVQAASLLVDNLFRRLDGEATASSVMAAKLITRESTGAR